ncbi:HAD domain-containing protein [Streptomyces sp. NPDC046371]|uniref:HAD domain-containing protein n=1 Tax=unclassified Streptomyces TaxID=2593676 RepID=UPI0033F61BEA
MRPLLFLDVDGPLIPFGGPGPHPAYAPEPPPDAHPLLRRVDPAHGRRLTALGCELVWATTWTDEANDVLAPRLKLERLPVVHWPDEEQEPGAGAAGLHWKTRALAAWAAGRRYVWLDDEITRADRDWVTTCHTAPALLHRIDPQRGLTEADYAAVAAWVGEYGATRR